MVLANFLDIIACIVVFIYNLFVYKNSGGMSLDRSTFFNDPDYQLMKGFGAESLRWIMIFNVCILKTVIGMTMWFATMGKSVIGDIVVMSERNGSWHSELWLVIVIFYAVDGALFMYWLYWFSTKIRVGIALTIVAIMWGCVAVEFSLTWTVYTEEGFDGIVLGVAILYCVYLVFASFLLSGVGYTALFGDIPKIRASMFAKRAEFVKALHAQREESERREGPVVVPLEDRWAPREASSSRV